MKFKKLNEVDVVEEVSEILGVDESGVKRVPAGSIGKVKTVNGTEPDENGNVKIDIPEPVEHTWETLPDKPFEAMVLSGVLCEDISWDSINQYNVSVNKWKKCGELIPDIINVANALNGIENTIVGYENTTGCLVMSEDSKVVYGYEQNDFVNNYSPKYLIVLEDNVTVTVDSMDLTFTESGFYTSYGLEGGPYPVAYEHTVIKTLDPKYLPIDYIKQLIAEVTA